MFKRQIKNAKYQKLFNFFTEPVNARQRQYEAVRAIVIDGISVEEVAKKFNYREGTLYALLREAKGERIDLFPAIPRQKKTRKIPESLHAEAVRLRDSGMSAKDICGVFADKEVNVSLRTIERLLTELGF